MREQDHLSENEVFFSFMPEIGNALAGVLSATQALRNGAANDPEFRRDLLDIMEDRLHFLRIIFENLVISGPMLSGKKELYPRLVEPSTWLTDFLASWRRRAVEKGLYWEIRVASDLPIARVDQQLVELALENLLSVSIAAAPEATPLRVASGYSRGESSLWVEISDQGPELSGRALAEAIRESGISRASGPRLADGRYIGLLIAGTVARLHGGRLEVVPRPGYNCSMRISLAAAENPAVFDSDTLSVK